MVGSQPTLTIKNLLLLRRRAFYFLGNLEFIRQIRQKLTLKVEAPIVKGMESTMREVDNRAVLFMVGHIHYTIYRLELLYWSTRTAAAG
jgi:hypothetical protein